MLIPISPSHRRIILRRRRRGSVIVLVVAVLGLLAVIGTVYIVSARSAHQSSTNDSIAYNLDLAQAAVHANVIDTIGGNIYDTTGTIGGYTGGGMQGSHTARRWDIPEIGTTTFGTAGYNIAYRDEPWLVTNLYHAVVPPPGTNAAYNDLSYLTIGPFDPSTGTYVPGGFSTVGSFRVVADTVPAGDGDDAFIQLLPFSEASGIRYRFGVRILDTSRMANLNVGMVYPSPDNAALAGTFFTGYNLASPYIMVFPGDSGPAGTFMNDIAGRTGKWVMPTGTIYPNEYWWLSATMRFESPQTFPTTPFDFSDELELRSYGSLGTIFTPRVVNLLPATLGNKSAPTNVTGNPNRGFYTAYSYSRDLRPFPANDFSAGAQPFNPYTVTGLNLRPPSGTSYVWPPFPARVNANPLLANGNITTPDQLATAATNIATAMELVPPATGIATYTGYTATEARAFAANYLTYHAASWTTDANGHYTLGNGLSFIDDAGLCVRTAAYSHEFGGAGNTTDLTSKTANKIFLGYAAQPFINEIVVSQTLPPMATTPVIDDSAIELYNPYPQPISLKDFKLHTGAMDYAFAADDFIPANGYFVVAHGPIAATIPSSGTVQVKTDPAFDLTGATKVYLMRSYIPRGGNASAPAYGAVDQYDATAAVSPTPVPTAAVIISLARNNADAMNTNIWAATVETPASEAPAAGPPTLGAANPHVADPISDKAPQLYDATMFHGGNATSESLSFANIADFNLIMRIANQIDTSTAGLPAGDGPISFQLNAIIPQAATDPNVMNTQFPVDASLHFDFAAAPHMYNFNVQGLPAPDPAYTGPVVMGDPRAVHLLDCLAFSDRVSDYNVNIGDNNATARGISKLRIPGQLNVNTAPPEVLATIPAFANMAASLQNIGLVLAYRWRTQTTDPRILAPYQYTSSLIDFSDQAKYPGYGIRSLAELNAVLTANVPPGTYTSIAARDQLWAQMYNYLTVRSDTFVLYAYLEAVKQNPRFTGAFNNSTVWYGNSFTDNPNDINIQSIPLLRVARRRWVSLIDRSQANSLATKPRILATKDLPQ